MDRPNPAFFPPNPDFFTRNTAVSPLNPSRAPTACATLTLRPVLPWM